MLLFVDGFDHYGAADILKKWTGQLVNPDAIGMGAGRFGGQSLLLPKPVFSSYQPSCITKQLGANYSTLIAGFAYQTTGIPTNNNRTASLIAFRDASTQQLALRVNQNGNLVVSRNGTVLATSAYALPINSWVYIEFKAVIHGTAGAYEVRVNTTPVLTGSAVNTSGAGTVNINTMVLGSNENNIGDTGTLCWMFDDLYLCDTTGTKNNNFLGDMRVDTLRPNGVGSNTQLDSPSVFGAHRYWRVYFSDVNGGNGITITEVQLRTVVGGANVATGGTVTANGNTGGYVPSMAFDNNAGTCWFFGNAANNWLAYDFGAGSTRDIREFTVTNTPSSGMAGLDTSPKNIVLQYSDDGVIWKTLFATPPQIGWSFNETRTFTVSLIANTDMMNRNVIDPATYLSSFTADKKDTYAFSNLVNIRSDIMGVQVSNVAAKNDSGLRSVANIVLAGGVEQQSTPQQVTASQLVYTSVHELNPATASAWTVSGVNNAEFGVIVK